MANIVGHLVVRTEPFDQLRRTAAAQLGGGQLPVAGVRLNLTSSAVSKSVERLEARLGYYLIVTLEKLVLNMIGNLV